MLQTCSTIYYNFVVTYSIKWWSLVGNTQKEKVHFTPFTNSLCPLNPLTKFRLNLLPHTNSISLVYPYWDFSFFYFSTYKWNFNFKLCNVTYNMMPYARKIHYDFYINIFHIGLYLYGKFCVKMFPTYETKYEIF